MAQSKIKIHLNIVFRGPFRSDVEHLMLRAWANDKIKKFFAEEEIDPSQIEFEQGHMVLLDEKLATFIRMKYLDEEVKLGICDLNNMNTKVSFIMK